MVPNSDEIPTIAGYQSHRGGGDGSRSPQGGGRRALDLFGRHLGLWNDKLSLQVTEAKTRELLERAASVIVRHVKDPTVLAALRADLADVIGGGDA
jgi:hypothetical protein